MRQYRLGSGLAGRDFDPRPLELSNVANLPITIYPEMKIGQLPFVQMAEPTATRTPSGLGSKYQGQRGPTPSRYSRNFESA